jgi:hypothetical protein|tara:strand:- start:17 stop:247 length:231 start_codon:yes stop_codon:yes gene_type:complete
MVKRVHLEASRLIPANPIGEYGELYSARSFDSGDRVSYGHGVGFKTMTVMVDGEPVSITIPVGRPSKYRGARQFVS